MKNFIFLYMFAFIFFTSCEKDPKITVQNPVNVQTAMLVSDSNFYKNQLNYLDYVGQSHNDLIIELHSLWLAGGSTLSYEELYDSILLATYPSISDFDMEQFNSGFYSLVLDGDSIDYEGYIDDLSISESLKAQLKDLFQELSQYNGSNIQSIISRVKVMETSVIAQPNSQDRDLFLMTASIGRYSLYLWDKPLSGQTLKMPWKNIVIGLCDALGGVAGFSAGGPTVVGNIAGAIAGAGATSAGAASLWDLWID